MLVRSATTARPELGGVVAGVTRTVSKVLLAGSSEDGEATPRPDGWDGSPPQEFAGAALLRVIEQHTPTILLDEFDTLMKGDAEMGETLRGLINSGFDRAEHAAGLQDEDRSAAVPVCRTQVELESSKRPGCSAKRSFPATR